MQTHKLIVFPNPYAHLDQHGALSGACPEADAPRPTTQMPSRRTVCATLSVVPGTYNNRKDEGRGSMPDGRPAGPRGSRAVMRWAFSTEPLVLSVTADMVSYYAKRARAGEVFMAESVDDVPIEGWAKARRAARAMLKREHNMDAPLQLWQEQFPLDEVVAEAEALLPPEPEPVTAPPAPQGPPPGLAAGRAALERMRAASAQAQAPAGAQAAPQPEAAPVPTAVTEPAPAPDGAPARTRKKE